jgi:hypothetical protein
MRTRLALRTREAGKPLCERPSRDIVGDGSAARLRRRDARSAPGRNRCRARQEYQLPIAGGLGEGDTGNPELIAQSDETPFAVD